MQAPFDGVPACVIYLYSNLLCPEALRSYDAKIIFSSLFAYFC